MKLKLVKTINFNEKGNDDQELSFLNNWLCTSMRRINFIELGHTKRFFHRNDQQSVRNSNILRFDGYSANFCRLQSGLYLKIDTACKFAHKLTVLQHINSLYEQNKSLNKADRRQVVKDSLKGMMVMANYGNFSHWRIEEVLFDQ